MLHDLFTRGVDIKTGKLRQKYEDAPYLYKDSKLGWIPKEWETRSIIETTYIKGRIGWEGLRADEFIEEGPYLITGTDIYNGKINWSKSYHISETRFNRSPNIHVIENDILITKDGTIGKTAFVENCPKKAILNSGLFLLRCKDESYINKYLFYILNSFYFDDFIRTSLGGSTIVHLYQRSFEKFRFPVPLISEQEIIIQRINSINKRIDEENSYLIKIQQLKSGLMTDLLGGKTKINSKYL
ncbi:MAG: restriction endonuclease subunit S [Ignavibacteria bacterium]|nr:restriction endonuclease subunit S [Ignavibacteria bacterium]